MGLLRNRPPSFKTVKSSINLKTFANLFTLFMSVFIFFHFLYLLVLKKAKTKNLKNCPCPDSMGIPITSLNILLPIAVFVW